MPFQNAHRIRPLLDFLKACAPFSVPTWTSQVEYTAPPRAVVTKRPGAQHPPRRTAFLLPPSPQRNYNTVVELNLYQLALRVALQARTRKRALSIGKTAGTTDAARVGLLLGVASRPATTVPAPPGGQRPFKTPAAAAPGQKGAQPRGAQRWWRGALPRPQLTARRAVCVRGLASHTPGMARC